jgi:hypothetical protein
LQYPYFDQIFDNYYKDKDYLIRIACVKGAAELGLKSHIKKMEKIEKKSEVIAIISTILEKWDYMKVNNLK